MTALLATAATIEPPARNVRSRRFCGRSDRIRCSLKADTAKHVDARHASENHGRSAISEPTGCEVHIVEVGSWCSLVATTRIPHDSMDRL